MKISPGLEELVKQNLMSSDEEQFERKSTVIEGDENEYYQIQQIPPRRAKRSPSPMQSDSQSKLKSNPYTVDPSKNTSAIASAYNRSVHIPLEEGGQHPNSRQHHRKNQISETQTASKPLQTQIIVKIQPTSSNSTFFRRDLNRLKQLQTVGELHKGASRSVQKDSRFRINRTTTQNESSKPEDEMQASASQLRGLNHQESKLQQKFEKLINFSLDTKIDDLSKRVEFLNKRQSNKDNMISALGIQNVKAGMTGGFNASQTSQGRKSGFNPPKTVKFDIQELEK
ncbi:hypothetical protein FGO68_gene7639 [Halteria grandinella]|uniref:Uncharacterized protein n=1 Tax=Halteria grandinella TaxID=5974 RepID=A0A8J8NW93_HALGN|nr:hypothetical protein FGO68_gene7639 [Halteria grandinella]